MEPVLTVYQLPVAPVMPPENVPIFQLKLVVELKLVAEPLTSGPMPDSVQRLRLNVVPLFAVIVRAPVPLTRSQPVPAAPAASKSCQL